GAVINIATPSAPVAGAVTQPTCAVATATVALSGLPVTAWTVTASPGGATITGTTATADFAGLTAGTTYTFTVTLTSSGCTSAASGNAVISAQPVTPSCSISGPASVDPGSTGNVFTSTVNPVDNVNHSWSITGDGTISGLTTGSTVNVDAGTAGSFKLTDNISRFGCSSTCTYDVIVCGITPSTASVPSGTTTTFTAPAGMDSYFWSLAGDGIVTGGGGNEPTVTVLAGNCNSYTLTITMTKGAASSTCTPTVTIIDDIAPTFNLPVTALSYCANSIIDATFNATPLDPEYDDLTTPRPEYYKFIHGSTEFNLSAVAGNFADNCCAVNDLVLHWKIDFSPVPDPDPTHLPLHNPVTKAPITDQIGQPSAYGSDILFPSDGLNFTDVTHKLIYWLVDCHGKASAEQTVNITVKPRPRIIK
ncbi:MAG: hypothetical protein NTY07_00550, partial [Bacteroidia bacterium]|nr:hypothetical protein [Bacteroidia bacterium]